MNDKINPANTGKEGRPSREEELIAYLDGELDAADRVRLRALMAEDQDLREALQQHKAIAAAIAAPDSEAGMSPRQTLAEVRGRLRRSRRIITAGILAAAAAAIFAVLIGARLITGIPNPEDQVPGLTQRPPGGYSPTEVIAELDVLEIIQEEGGELSLELVNLLLEEDEDAGVLDSGLFDNWLEEEISGENF